MTARSAGTRPCISIVVPLLNARTYLERCLGGAVAAAHADGAAEVVVVDNGSTDGSRETVQREFAGRVRLLDAPGLAVGAVRNAGAQAAGGEILAFLDADCLVDADYLTQVRAALADPTVAATGAMYDLPERPVWTEATWHRLHFRAKDGPVVYLNAGNFAIRRAAFQAVGGFDPSLVTGEDAELGQRLVDGGYRIVERRAVRARHLGNPKSLGQFYRKQVWHALGMFGTARGGRLDRPIAMTFFHLALSLGGVAALLLAPLPFAGRVGVFLAATWFVPILTALFRALQVRQLPNPLGAALLYQLYYAARITGLWHIAVAFVRPGKADARLRALRG